MSPRCPFSIVIRPASKIAGNLVWIGAFWHVSQVQKTKIALPGQEPKPGEWMPNEDFERIVRLTPLVAIDLVVRLPDRRALVGRRTHQPSKNMLFVPGARITKNERIAAAFERISEEELGIRKGVSEGRLLGVFEHFYSENRLEKPGFGTHYVVIAYELQVPEPLRSLPADQHSEYYWLTPAEMVASPEVHENTKAYFRTAAR
jgi:colanic acid biosynthesis protein WcaH